MFEFVHATNDHQDGAPVGLLASIDLASLGALAGAWNTFELAVEPSAPPRRRLVSRIVGVDVYRGDLPEGGPTSGVFQIGFRENHADGPAAGEGTWTDGLQILSRGPRRDVRFPTK